MLSRRHLLAALGAAGALAPGFGALVPGFALAQSATDGRMLHIGTLTPGAPLIADSPYGKALIQALAEHGYVIGRNLAFSARGTDGDLAKLPAQLDALKEEHVDIVVAIGYPTALAAKQSGIPTLIAWGSGDPVNTGLVESWAHPGGNVTGVSDVASTLTAKRMQLLKEFSPSLRKVAMIWNQDDLGMTLRYKASSDTAKALGIEILPLGVREPDDFNGSFEAMDKGKPDAILMVADSLTVLNRKRIFDYASSNRLPAIYEYDFIIRDGGLMSYGSDIPESLGRVASMADRIFKGAKPGDLPFEQPTRYPFVLNLKVAKAMGLTPPKTLLAMADEVIE